MIKIYDINDKLLMQAEVTSAAKREQEMSKSDYITLSFSAAEKVILPVGAYINYTYKIDKVREVTRKFLLLDSYEPTQSDECSWKYTPQFQHPKMILSKTPFFIYTRNSQNVEVKQNVWSFVGITSVLSEKIKDFLNKDLMFGECGWKVIFSNVTANTVNVSFSDNDFISALTAITNAIGDNCEWHIDYDDEIIYIGKVLIGATPVVLEVGKNVGVPSINNSKEGYYNAFSIFGGTRNITQVNSKGENVSSGDIRLQLDEGNGTMTIDGKECSYSIDKYSTLDLRADKTKEPLFTKVLDFSQIYPSLNTYVYNVRGRVKYVLDDNNKKIPISYNADGSVKEYKTFTVWYMKLAYPTTGKVEGKTIINTTVDDGVTHYWYDFEVTDNLLIKGKNIGCSFEANFNTGALSTPLAGRGTNGDYVGFELTYHKEASSSHTSDDVSKDNFSVLAGDYEIIYQEDNEVIIPTNKEEMLIPRGERLPSLKCNITVLYNIAMADTIYYEDAQNRLLEKAKEEIVQLLSDLNNYEVKSYSDVFLEDNPQLQIGQSVTYKDGHGYELATRVLKLSTNIDYDFIQSITIGNQVIKGTITQLKEDVQTIIASGGSSGNGGGYSVSQLRKLIAKYGSDNFISKQFDDIANGTITFQKIQKFLQGMKVGANGDWTLDELDNTHLTTDYLQVRMKAIFETLEILHTDTLGGELFITTVGSNRILKVEEVNITYDGVSQKAYRCYFLGEQDGSKVENKWKVGDQARSKSFNLTAGKYHNVGNHYYWRLVIGVSSEAVEIDGKKYHYVDLSDIDKDAASDEPMVDDILNQCGNRTDITRQSCLVFSAVDTYSPCITLYHGVDGYTFNNKEYVDYGVNHSTNKAFFHVYGDMYFGDRPTSANNYEGDSYVKYDSDKKKVTIKGDLDIKSTYDGKTLDKYITEKSLDKNAVETIIKKSDTITDLQNQIDGAIETWFYDGVPTLKTEPASGWDTDMMKNHLGDLYYDNKTGKAYRFAKDGSTYKWIIITDTELTKAIEDSSQALKDAKSKRRIFGSQPVPPYDVNDMWVNATYPSDGSTYKNEILKCSTSKAEGEEFDIADWKLASKYTDDTKAEEAKKAAEKAQAEIKNTQTNLITLGTTVSNNKKAFDVFTSDGYLDSSEIAAIAQDSKRLEDDYNAAVESYNNVVGSKFLLDKDGKETTYKTDLVSAKATLDSAKNELITYLSDIVSRYNASDSNGKATIKAAAAQKYTNFTNAYKAFYDKLGVANNYITSNLFDGLNTKLITNMAGLEYIKAALVDGDTVVKGGLILSTLIALRNDKGNVTAGINGADTKENGIALWLGGKAIDKQASTTTEEEKKIAAKSLLRFDGTGYFANGNLWWDADGTLHADPTSFIINKNNVGVQLALFAPVWKSGTTDTTKLANVLSIDPQKPFTHLDVSGNVTTEGSLKIGGIYLSYDSANNALRLSKDAAGKEAANFYTTGGITAYGAGASTTGGGGLNGSVKSYSNALKLTSESLSEIASAYSIKALDSRISSLEGGSATAISVSGSGNAVTSVTKNGTTISVVKGSTFLTSHQSLDGYVNAISVSGSGNAITSVSKSGKGITFTKGATFLTSHQSLANYYTKSSVDSLLSGKSATSHTHSVIINGTTKIIAASGGTAVNLGTYLTSHQSLADYAKKTDIPTSLKSPNSLSWSGYNTGSYDGSSPKSFVIPSNTNQLTNGAGFITSSASISGNAATATKVNHSLLVFGKSFNGSADVTVADTDLIASISTGTSNVTDKTEILTSYASDNGFNDSNAKNKIHRRPASAIWGYINSKTISNADKLDNVHLNGIFTALSNTNNGVSMTIGTVAKSLANMQVYSATKLVTARNISIAGRDFVGNVNFDGTGNVSLNGAINYCTINIGNTDPNPFKRIAHIKVAHSWNDNALLLYISQGYHGGNFGLCRVEFRTNDIANSDTAGGNVSLRWLIRQGYATDSIQAGYYIHLKNAYVDVFLKTTGAYQGTVIRVIQDSRGSINNSFGLINSTYNTEAYTSLSAAATALYNVAYQGTVSGTDTCTVSHANSATKLQTPRTIWGQSFDGTGNVNGTIYINNSDSENGAIILNNNVNTHARISAIKDQVVFNTGAAIRFGATNWECSDWAGLKYDTVANAIYLGIADGTVFNYCSNKRSNGTLKFPGITTITPDSGARIGGSGGDLYLGNANNSNYVKVQDICSQVDRNNWRIGQGGYALFKDITIINTATINGSTHINNLLTAKGIMPTTADVNAFGTNVNNWEGSIAANVTNMFNGIPIDKIQVEYSTDNGASWNTYPGNPEHRFNLVNDNTGGINYYLGNNNTNGSSDADKLAQIKKNQLRVTVKIPDEIYQELSWISIDVSNGVNIKCQVYFGSSTGGYKEYVSKIMRGWSHKCDICVGPLNVNVGNDTYRYVRLVFSHPSNNTNLRNGIVAKIRALALTKYIRKSDRYTISTTGHIYDYDAYMNTYFPNSIRAKGGVTAYQSSDIRLKQDLRKLDYFGIIKAMGGTFGFAWKKDNTRSIGWIAQHVLCNPHLKDIVETDEKGYYKINYWSPKLIATAFGAIEQVGDEVSRLKARVVFLESEVQRLSGDKEDCNKKRLDNKNINSLN